MNTALKILKLFAILIITVLISLFSASFLLKDKVAGIILKSLNNNISTKLNGGSFKLSFLSKFPKASLVLKDVLVHSSPGFISSSFTGINTDTLMAARFVSVEFSITDILKSKYTIERISARAGRINFFTDKAGFVNYNISVKSAKSGVNDFTINLEKINLTDIKANYINLATRLNINGKIKNGKLKSKISGNDIDFTGAAEIQIDSLQIFNTKIRNTVAADLDLTLKSFKNGHIEMNCLLNKGHISFGKSDLAFNDFSFIGYFSNGSKNRPETTSLSIKNLKAKLGSAEYTGSLELSGFDQPKVKLLLKGKVFPGELKEFFDLQNISEAEGWVDLDIKIESKLNHILNYNFSDIIDLKPEAGLTFNSFTLGLQNSKMLFEQVNGNLSVSNSIRARNFQFTYQGQKVKVDGEFRNLPEWLSGMPVQMNASADVSFSRLKPELFLKNGFSSDASAKNITAFTLPDDIILDINFQIDSLSYKSFSSSKIVGTFNYKPRLLTFKSLNMQSLKGMISGNGFIVQNSNKSIIAKGSFNVTKIDVNETFTTFHNFGQDFLKAENLKGALSGSLSLLLPMDSMLNPQIKSVTAEGKYLLVNGALINFDPVRYLSSFIELSELENISFEQMQNDFFIRNNSLYVPQMEVKSSAANLSVNGKHSFDNDYEYHVKILLSEILSKKRKKIKSNVSEFGVVEDDGLGRTSLLLKIKGKGEAIKVGYDIKAAGNELKNNIKSERQSLKSILSQEYGWFKSDTATNQKPVVKKSRFRITWDETDSIKSRETGSSIQKNRGKLK
ncbi:MAG: AsmA-like C-terminal region-containing protein [Bacteroidota bacterium]